MKSHSSALFALASGSLLALSRCAGIDGRNNKQRALVCPQCNMVGVAVEQPYYVGGRPSWFGRGSPAVVYRDECPNCQGALETFFREGKWKHKCSVCKDTPYTCPILHP